MSYRRLWASTRHGVPARCDKYCKRVVAIGYEAKLIKTPHELKFDQGEIHFGSVFEQGNREPSVTDADLSVMGPRKYFSRTFLTLLTACIPASH